MTVIFHKFEVKIKNNCIFSEGDKYSRSEQ